mmetsp:Transcript_26082/g.53432  ORF Transcript_26082/g.53432 Transcript_26082/m.53432 type:complete len:352 (+) Transcript_26082:95-1150(+)
MATPPEFICPLSGLRMKDPVTAADGNTYDKKPFLKWIEDNETSPITGEDLLHTEFEANYDVAMNIEDWKRRTGVDGDDSEDESDEDGEDDELVVDDSKEDPQKKVDRKALDNLYVSTRGDQCWENIDGWDEGSNNLDEWWGLTLSTSEATEGKAMAMGIPMDSLVRIKLCDNGLSGTLPTSIQNFKNLIILNLYKNLIAGPIPNLGRLRNLMKLDLSRNRFTGPIPTSIGKLICLEKLNIQNNILTGIFPPEIIGLSCLIYLDLSRNDLTGFVPEDIGYMEPLEILCFNDNRFSGVVPETVTLLTNLEKLTVQYNEFEVDPHWLLEYIPEDCEFEADEEAICQIEMLKKKR